MQKVAPALTHAVRRAIVLGSSPTPRLVAHAVRRAIVLGKVDVESLLMRRHCAELEVEIDSEINEQMESEIEVDGEMEPRPCEMDGEAMGGEAAAERSVRRRTEGDLGPSVVIRSWIDGKPAVTLSAPGAAASHTCRGSSPSACSHAAPVWRALPTHATRPSACRSAADACRPPVRLPQCASSSTRRTCRRAG